MKVLFIADILPELHSGSAVRNYYLLKTLANKYDVDFVGLTNDKNVVSMNIYKNLHTKSVTILNRKKIPFFKKLFYLIRGEIPYIQQRRNIHLPEEISNTLLMYDAIHVAELNSYFMLEKYTRDIKNPIILDAHNVEYIRFSSEIKHASLFTKFVGKILSHKLKQLEIQALKSINHLCVCSSVDKKYFKKYILEKNITVIPNGVNISYYTSHNKKTSGNANILLFMGLLSYFPNDEGLQYYLSKIHPVIKKYIPDIEFHIIGKDAPTWLEEESKKDKSIKLLGFVEDTRSYITNATICIAPLLSGSGTRLKILEYMAIKKPIVATIQAAEGIEVTNKKNILLASNTDEFIQEIISLFNNKKLSKDLGIHAQKLVKDTYDWKIIGKEFISMYEHIFD
ncbi:MAG TPA: glycosyltransferase family 4 protein [Candidatus Saccharimonadales bacterium]|nr:glycosyltransferase family 4 protein [Candidatus Saccharimonadales bacterium]